MVQNSRELTAVSSGACVNWIYARCVLVSRKRILNLIDDQEILELSKILRSHELHEVEWELNSLPNINM